MLNKTFSGILNKLQERGGDDAHTQLSIKYSSQSPDFFASLNPVFDTNNISKYVETPDKFKISMSSNLAVTVEFDEVEFDATISELKFSKKIKKGEITFDCEIRMEKAIDDMNKVLGVEYLNRREEDADGKSKLVLYPVKIEKKEDK